MAITMVLEKEDLCRLINGTSPTYDQMNIPAVKRCGHLVGGFCDRWDWDFYELKKLTEEELEILYLTLR